MSDKPKPRPMTDGEIESQVYRSIPPYERLGSMAAWIGSSVAFGIGTGSIAIGIGTFLGLFFVVSKLSIEMTKHRGCQKAGS